MVRWTFVFLIVCTAVFLLQSAELFDWKLFAFTPALAFERPWTFVTSIFLHADFLHLFFNMFALFMFGLVLENRIGSRNFVIIFFLSGIMGSMGYLVTASDSTIPALGASGAIYGVIGTLTVLMPLMTVWFGGIPMPMIAAALLWVLVEFFGMFIPSDIAHSAHLGGIFAGIIYGIYLRRSEGRRRKRFFDKYVSY